MQCNSLAAWGLVQNPSNWHDFQRAQSERPWNVHAWESSDLNWCLGETFWGLRRTPESLPRLPAVEATDPVSSSTDPGAAGPGFGAARSACLHSWAARPHHRAVTICTDRGREVFAGLGPPGVLLCCRRGANSSDLSDSGSGSRARGSFEAAAGGSARPSGELTPRLIQPATCGSPGASGESPPQPHPLAHTRRRLP